MVSGRFEQKNSDDTKGVIRNRKSKKNTPHNGQKKKNKRTNNDLRNTTLKSKDRVTRTPLKTEGEVMCSISGTRQCFILKLNS